MHLRAEGDLSRIDIVTGSRYTSLPVPTPTTFTSDLFGQHEMLDIKLAPHITLCLVDEHEYHRQDTSICGFP